MAGEPGNVPLAVRRRAARCAAVVGLANGLIVSVLNVHGFVATLGIGLVISGYLATNYQGNHGLRAARRSGCSAPPRSARYRSRR